MLDIVVIAVAAEEMILARWWSRSRQSVAVLAVLRKWPRRSTTRMAERPLADLWQRFLIDEQSPREPWLLLPEVLYLNLSTFALQSVLPQVRAKLRYGERNSRIIERCNR